MCIDGREVVAGSDIDLDLSKLRLRVWSTTPRQQLSSSDTAGTMVPLSGDGDAENQLIYVVLGTVLGVVVLVVVVCVAMCMWRHQQQPRRAVCVYTTISFISLRVYC